MCTSSNIMTGWLAWKLIYYKIHSHNPQMTHLHPLSHVCVQYEKNPAKVSEISSGNEHAERPDMLLTISSPYFVGGDKEEEKAEK